MRKALVRNVAREIRNSVIREAPLQRAAPRPARAGIADLLLERLAEKVLQQLETEMDDTEAPTDLEDRVSSLEMAVNKLAPAEIDEADDDDDGGRFPNLKYAKPKYKDVESVLKYVESDDDGGALKVVIMNFND